MLLLMLTLLLMFPLLMLPLLSASCFLVLRRTAGLRRGFTVAVVVATATVAAVVVVALDIGVVTAADGVGVVKVMLAAIGVGCRVTLPIVCDCGPKLKLIVGAGV